VFCHPALGSPLYPSKVSGYMHKAIEAAASNGAFALGTTCATRRHSPNAVRVSLVQSVAVGVDLRLCTIRLTREHDDDAKHQDRHTVHASRI